MIVRFLCLLVLSFAAWAAPKPANVSASIWVREDLFAGFLDGDMTTFERGERKVDELLAEDPKAPGVRAWKLSAEFFRAVLLYEAKDQAAFEQRYGEVIQKFEDLRREAPANVGVLAIYGGMIATLGHRLPARLQPAANERAKEAYLQLERLQRAEFDTMPVHHRGEVLAGVAQSSARSGQHELARLYLSKIVDTLQGTPYAAFANMMLKDPDKMSTTKSPATAVTNRTG
jgi:hypothetical protein